MVRQRFFKATFCALYNRSIELEPTRLFIIITLTSIHRHFCDTLAVGLLVHVSASSQNFPIICRKEKQKTPFSRVRVYSKKFFLLFSSLPKPNRITGLTIQPHKRRTQKRVRL